MSQGNGGSNPSPTAISAGRYRLLLGLVLLVTFAAFAPSLDNHFAMDDRAIAKARYDEGGTNPMVSELRPLGDYFASHYWRGTTESSPLYRPVTILSYALCRALSGPDASEAEEALPHHVANVLLHVIATLLCALLIAELAPGWPSLLGAAVFGLHAVHSEVVAGIAGRAELLGFVFGAAAALLWIKHGRLALRTMLIALLLFLAFCSKENAVAWAPMLVVLGLARRQRAWSALAVAAVPLIAWIVLRHGAVSAAEATRYLVNPLAHASASERIAGAVPILAYGLYKTLLPFSLASDYGAASFDLNASFVSLQFLGSTALLVGLLVLGLRTGRRHALVLVAVAAFFGFSFLTSNIPFSIGTIFGERLFYTPSLGLACLAAFGLQVVRCRTIAVAGCVVWIAASTFVIITRNPVWHDDKSLFLHDARIQPRSARLALSAAQLTEDPEERFELLQSAVHSYPGYVDALLSLGVHYVQTGSYPLSERAFRAALASPHFDEAKNGFPIRINLLPVLLHEHRFRDAKHELDILFASHGQAFANRQAQMLDLAATFASSGNREAAAGIYELIAGDARFPQALRDRAKRER